MPDQPNRRWTGGAISGPPGDACFFFVFSSMGGGFVVDDGGDGAGDLGRLFLADRVAGARDLAKLRRAGPPAMLSNTRRAFSGGVMRSCEPTMIAVGTLIFAASASMRPPASMRAA